MKSPEDLKELLMKRAEERLRQEEDLEFTQEEELPEEELPEEAPLEEEMGGLFEIKTLLQEVEEQGFEAYVSGAQQEENPYTEAEELAEMWEGGWYGAHVQTCTTNILVSAKKLVDAASAEEAEEAMKNLEEAITFAKDVIDFEDAEAFLNMILEGGEVEPT